MRTHAMSVTAAAAPMCPAAAAAAEPVVKSVVTDTLSVDLALATPPSGDSTSSPAAVARYRVSRVAAGNGGEAWRARPLSRTSLSDCSRRNDDDVVWLRLFFTDLVAPPARAHAASPTHRSRQINRSRIPDRRRRLKTLQGICGKGI